MKKFLRKFLIYVLILGVLDILFCYAVDPFNVMHTRWIRENGVEPNRNVVKINYILDNPDKFDSLMFGSSRVGNIHVEKITSEHCYNMFYSQGLPKEHLENIKTLVKAGAKPKKVYIGVDSISYTVYPTSHYKQDLRCPYEYLKSHPLTFARFYLDPAVVFTSLTDIIIHHEPMEGYVERFYEYGWEKDYGYKTSYDFDHAEPDVSGAMLIDETLQTMREITEVCSENDIELVVFTNPMYCLTYEESVRKNYLDFLKGLAEITPYYNFSGLNSITTNNANYIDSSHYTAEIGDILLDVMCNGKHYEDLEKEGFGVYVTSGNVDEILDILISCYNGG